MALNIEELLTYYLLGTMFQGHVQLIGLESFKQSACNHVHEQS